MRRTTGRLIASAIVVLTALLHGETLSTLLAQCWNVSTVAVAKTDRGYVTEGGIRHITYEIPGGWGSDIRNRIQNAIDQWNAKTGTTKVTFEPYDPNYPIPGLLPSFRFDSLSSAEVVCGRYSAGDNQRIYLHPDLISAASNPNIAAAKVAQIIAHELGHTMNLGEGQGIMQVPPYGDCTATAINTFPGTTVQNADASTAAGCVNQIIQSAVYPGNYNEDDLESQGGDCWELYRIYYGWEYVGNGQYEIQVYATSLIDAGCGPPPV